MNGPIQVFRRVEQKYRINEDQFQKIKESIVDYMNTDPYGESTICNIYFDTDDYDLIRTSLEKPPYKEKIRLRSYGTPKNDSLVFLEIKKKYDGVVGKRRVAMTLKQAYDYIEYGVIPEDSQIMREIDYCFKHYEIEKKLYLAYDRIAYLGKDNPEFRITFDYHIRSRTDQLNLENGSSGKLLLQDGDYIMEVKSISGMPLWFSKLLCDLKIYPTSFSKYGEIYQNSLRKKEKNYV